MQMRSRILISRFESERGALRSAEWRRELFLRGMIFMQRAREGIKGLN
jgi:hypothetical protein